MIRSTSRWFCSTSPRAPRRRCSSGLAEQAGVVLGRAAAEISRALADRERLGSTGVGAEVALPHADVPGLARSLTLFARPARPVEWDADRRSPGRADRRGPCRRRSPNARRRPTSRGSRVSSDAPTCATASPPRRATTRSAGSSRTAAEGGAGQGARVRRAPRRRSAFAACFRCGVDAVSCDVLASTWAPTRRRRPIGNSEDTSKFGRSCARLPEGFRQRKPPREEVVFCQRTGLRVRNGLLRPFKWAITRWNNPWP